MKVLENIYQNQQFSINAEAKAAAAEQAKEAASAAASEQIQTAQVEQKPAESATAPLAAPLAPRVFDAINSHMDALVATVKSADAAAISSAQKQLESAVGEAAASPVLNAEFLKQNSAQFIAAVQTPTPAQFAALLA